MGKAEIMDAPAVGGLGGTYSGNPMACASALAVLELDSWSQVAEGTAGVVAAGRPADDQWSVE